MVRFKNRYLVVELYTIDPKRGIIDFSATEPIPTTQSMAGLLRSQLATNFGQHGAALAGQSLSLKYCNALTGTLIIRAAREQLSTVWASITFAGGERMGLKVVKVTGTIRSAQMAAMKHAVGVLGAKLKQMERTEEREKIEEAIKSCKKAIRAIDA